MTKYNHEVRINVVKEIDNGGSIGGTARKYGIADTVVRGWYRRYQQGGIDGLIVTKQKYSADFKLAAVEYLLTHDVSLDQAAAALGIPTHTTLLVWKRQFLAEEGAGLQDTQKGRPPKMPKKPQKPSKPLS